MASLFGRDPRIGRCHDDLIRAFAGVCRVRWCVAFSFCTGGYFSVDIVVVGADFVFAFVNGDGCRRGCRESACQHHTVATHSSSSRQCMPVKINPVWFGMFMYESYQFLNIFLC